MLDLVERLPGGIRFLARSSAELRTLHNDSLSVNNEQGVTMTEAYILRRNIEKFRRMLDEETNQSTRRALEIMILEFEGMLSISELGKRSVGDQRLSDSSENT